MYIELHEYLKFFWKFKLDIFCILNFWYLEENIEELSKSGTIAAVINAIKRHEKVH